MLDANFNRTSGENGGGEDVAVAPPNPTEGITLIQPRSS